MVGSLMKKPYIMGLFCQGDNSRRKEREDDGHARLRVRALAILGLALLL